VTLDLCGFRKEIEISNAAYREGRVLIGVFPPVMKVAETLCLERDVRYDQIAFYRDSDGNIFKPKEEGRD
jgi:hypothetical protein